MTLSRCGTVSLVTTYPSLADFVDEVASNPPRMLQTSQKVAPNSCHIGDETLTYDEQKRLLSHAVGGLTYRYSAWDTSGRPMTGTISGPATPVTESWSYNDAARTSTLVQQNSGGSTSTTYTYDANANAVSVVVHAGRAISTSTTVIGATARLCK
jgi:hypothetical protein